MSMHGCFFYIRYMRYVYVPIWEHWAGRVTFFKINECTLQTTLLNAIFKPLGVNGNPSVTFPKYVGATK